MFIFFFFQAEDGIRDWSVTGVQTCALPISFPYPRADRIMEMRLVDKAGKDRYMGPSGPQADLIRQAKSIEDVTLMDWWNLTTTDGDLPEDVQANYIDPNAPNHWGIRALKGRWLIPSDAQQGQE